VCACQSKALLCESDRFSEFYYTKALGEYDPERSFERDHGQDGLLARNVRVLQVKDLDEVNEVAFRPYCPEFDAKASDYSQHFSKMQVHTLEKNRPPAWLNDSRIVSKESPCRVRALKPEPISVSAELLASVPAKDDQNALGDILKGQTYRNLA